MTQQSVVDQAKELEAMGYTREQVVSMLAQPTQVQVSKLRRPYTPDALDQEVSDFKAAKVAENQNSTYPVKAARVVFKIMSVVGEETGTLDPEPRDFDRIFRRSYPRNKLSTEGRGAHDTALAVMRGYSIWREENGFPNGFLENEEYYTVKDEQRREDALDSEELLAMIRAARGIADGSIRTRRTRVDKRGRNGESGHVRDEIDEQIPITLRCAYDTGTRPSEVVRLHEGNLSNKAMPGVGYPITFCHTKTADNLVRYLSPKTYEELVERIKSDAVQNAPTGICSYCKKTVRWYFPSLSESNNPNLRGKGPGYMSYWTLFRRFKQIAVHARITRRVHPHLLRSTRVTDIRMKAQDQKKDGVAMVRNLVGIKGDKIIELYTRPKGKKDRWKTEVAEMVLPELDEV